MSWLDVIETGTVILRGSVACCSGFRHFLHLPPPGSPTILITACDLCGTLAAALYALAVDADSQRFQRYLCGARRARQSSDCRVMEHADGFAVPISGQHILVLILRINLRWFSAEWLYWLESGRARRRRIEADPARHRLASPSCNSSAVHAVALADVWAKITSQTARAKA